MKFQAIGAIALLSFAAYAAPVFAGPIGVERNVTPNEQSARVSALETQRNAFAQQMPEPPKGPELARYVTRLDQLDKLIARLQSGETVAPEEIERAQQPVTR